MVEETKNEAEPAEEKKTLIFNLFSFSIACEQKGASVYEKIQKYTQSLVVGLLNLIIIIFLIMWLFKPLVLLDFHIIPYKFHDTYLVVY